MDEQVKEQTSDNPLQMPKEQAAAVCVQGQEQDKTDGGFFGKFRTKEQLVEAYNSLEAEFTRRSQRIKELETAAAQNKEEEKWAKRVAELTEKYPAAKELTAEIGEYIAEKKELIEDEGCLEKALLAVLSVKFGGKAEPEKAAVKPLATLRERAESAYKQTDEALLVPYVLPPGGELPTAPRIKPQSVKEAGDLARKLLKEV